jgi:hypothetical protein
MAGAAIRLTTKSVIARSRRVMPSWPVRLLDLFIYTGIPDTLAVVFLCVSYGLISIKHTVLAHNPLYNNNNPFKILLNFLNYENCINSIFLLLNEKM